MFTQTLHGRTGDGALVGRDGLGSVAHQLLGHSDCTAVATQEQAVTFEGSKVLADGHFRSFEMFGQLVHADFALLVEQGEDIVASLGGVSFRHGSDKFRFER